MKIEHFAFNTADPTALAQWYVAHLGLRIAREIGPPNHETFLVDDNDETVIEVYNRQADDKAPFGDLDPFAFHIAFNIDDMEAEIERLVTAGGTAVGDIATTPGGDKLAFVRDPWGNSIQLVQRQKPLIDK